jgi:hypothetical protein
MKGHITVLLIAGLLGLPSLTAAQTTADQKKLDVMAGKWTIEVDTKATPLSPANKASGTESVSGSPTGTSSAAVTPRARRVATARCER